LGCATNVDFNRPCEHSKVPSRRSGEGMAPVTWMLGLYWIIIASDAIMALRAKCHWKVNVVRGLHLVLFSRLINHHLNLAYDTYLILGYFVLLPGLFVSSSVVSYWPYFSQYISPRVTFCAIRILKCNLRSWKLWLVLARGDIVHRLIVSDNNQTQARQLLLEATSTQL
jgi:hypothetical protein